MKLVVVSDLHGSVAHLDAVREACAGAGALIACGDFTTFGDAARVQEMADALRVEGVPFFFVTGNCDAVPADVVLKGCRNLHGRVETLGEWRFAGVCGSLPCPAQTPREFKETFYSRLLAGFKESCGGNPGTFVLVSHQPPFGTDADVLPGGRHVGCRALRAFIDEAQPVCCLTGHIHEAMSRSYAGRTLVVNPGPFSHGHFAVVEL